MACLSRFSPRRAPPPPDASTPASSLKKVMPANESAAVRLPALARHKLASCGPRTLATRSACLSVCSSMSPPSGRDGEEMRLGAVVVQPLDQLTGVSGILADRSGSTTFVSNTPSNSSSDWSRCRPPGPMRTTEFVVSCRSSLTVYARTRRRDGFSPAFANRDDGAGRLEPRGVLRSVCAKTCSGPTSGGVQVGPESGEGGCCSQQAAGILELFGQCPCAGTSLGRGDGLASSRSAATRRTTATVAAITVAMAIRTARRRWDR